RAPARTRRRSGGSVSRSAALRAERSRRDLLPRRSAPGAGGSPWRAAGARARRGALPHRSPQLQTHGPVARPDGTHRRRHGNAQEGARGHDPLMDVGLTRRNIGRLVLLLWAVALAWLARREFAKDGAAGDAERTRRLEPGAQYFAVLAGGRQIGVLN